MALARLNMIYIIIPSFIDHFRKARHIYPNILKVEGFRVLRLGHSHLQVEEGNGRTKMKKGHASVGREGDIPIFITKEGIKLAHTRVLFLVAPSDLSVLKANLFNVTTI
jgi:transketolase C-terminal domain/subunit